MKYDRIWCKDLLSQANCPTQQLTCPQPAAAIELQGCDPENRKSARFGISLFKIFDTKHNKRWQHYNGGGNV